MINTVSPVGAVIRTSEVGAVAARRSALPRAMGNSWRSGSVPKLPTLARPVPLVSSPDSLQSGQRLRLRPRCLAVGPPYLGQRIPLARPMRGSGMVTRRGHGLAQGRIRSRSALLPPSTTRGHSRLCATRLDIGARPAVQWERRTTRATSSSRPRWSRGRTTWRRDTANRCSTIAISTASASGAGPRIGSGKRDFLCRRRNCATPIALRPSPALGTTPSAAERLRNVPRRA